METQRKPKWILWLLLCCLIIALGFASCITIGVLAWRNHDAELTILAKRDIKLIATKWDVEALYSRFDRASRQHVSRESAEQFMAALEKHLGHVVEVRSSSLIDFYAGTKERTGTVVSDVEFEKAIGTSTIEYVFEDDEWRIALFNVNSPALDNVLGRMAPAGGPSEE